MFSHSNLPKEMPDHHAFQVREDILLMWLNRSFKKLNNSAVDLNKLFARSPIEKT